MQLAEIDLEYVATVLATLALMPASVARQYRSLLCRAALSGDDDAWLREVEQHFRPAEGVMHGEVVRLRRGEWSPEEQRLCHALMAVILPAAATAPVTAVCLTQTA
ncbi:hypothetical protein [Teichococcus vastitatis]|uniref:Uncharacterized protein n=1 Tax=Teichococcus vastitatis TaxID=2307076 RepID=A0ABS9W6N2_9PROT|nr:hypothetical protein [Pseudoroseomonas vastitatis]MCI0754955.1 hypothetical protein [Pseudoroseomonas vastitatis]